MFRSGRASRLLHSFDHVRKTKSARMDAQLNETIGLLGQLNYKLGQPGLRALHQMADFGRANKAITYCCLGLNVAVFTGWQLGMGRPSDRRDANFKAWLLRRLHSNFLLKPKQWRDRPWTLITNAFSHIRLDHLLFNAISFWTFASILKFSVIATF